MDVEQLYADHHRSVLRICLRLAGGTGWAEDVVHEVFVRLLERKDELEHEDNIAGWLHTVAYRLCLDRLRRDRGIWSRVKAALGAEPAPPSRTPAMDLELSQRARTVQAALAQLPDKERAAMVMLHLDGMSQTEIAKVLGHSEGYVSKLIARATKTIRAAGFDVPEGDGG
jgi:RNA polymerase sigma-70 factor, ECF subfamily